jgi:exonuclease III
MTSQGSLASVAAARQSSERTVYAGGEERMEPKEDGVVRIGFNNINGLSTRTNDSKNCEVHGFIKDGEFDVFGMAETNIHWSNGKTQAKDLMYGWFARTHISYSYYKGYPGNTTYQVGGVLQLGIGEISCRIKQSGGDETGQGRWTWHTFAGKAQQTLRIITAYRPVKNTSNVGSVWHQQQFFADSNNLLGSPHERWIHDLKEAVHRWLQNGDSIVLMADFNDDVRAGAMVQTLKQLGLVDQLAIHYSHCAPTFARGSTTIDTILTSQEIEVQKCGYIRSPSDHLCVWIDIKAQNLFKQIHQPTPPRIRRLQCGDPRTVKRYTKTLWQEIQQHHILEDCNQLEIEGILRPTKRQRLWESWTRNC